MDNEMYPNDGEYFMPMEPVERQRQRQVAKSRTKANEELILDVLNRLYDRIAFFNSIESIPDSVIGDQELFRITVMAHKQTVANLNSEVNYWKGELKNRTL